MLALTVPGFSLRENVVFRATASERSKVLYLAGVKDRLLCLVSSGQIVRLSTGQRRFEDQDVFVPVNAASG